MSRVKSYPTIDNSFSSVDITINLMLLSSNSRKTKAAFFKKGILGARSHSVP